MGTRSVVVAGRRPPMLRSLKRLLEPEFEVAGMADNILSMLDVVKEIEPDLLVIDVGSAEFGAGDLARRLRERHPDLCMILVGDDVADAPGVADLSGTACVSKVRAQEALIPAARALVARTSRPRTPLAGPGGQQQP